MDLVRLAVQKFVAVEERQVPGKAGAAARQLSEISELAAGFANPYQDMVAAWRLDRTCRQLTALSNRHVDFDAWQAEVYLVNILKELLGRLDASSEVLAVTDPSFWHRTSNHPLGFCGPESAGMYLAAERDAIANGIRLVRVFLLDPASDPEIARPIIERHARFFEELRHKWPDRVDVRFRYYQDSEEARRHAGTFTCIRRRLDAGHAIPAAGDDAGCCVIETVNRGSEAVLLRLLFSNGSGRKDATTRPFLDQFYNALTDSHPIGSFKAAPALASPMK